MFVMNDIKELKELNKQQVGQTFVEHCFIFGFLC
jgi:hypothetical protein